MYDYWVTRDRFPTAVTGDRATCASVRQVRNNFPGSDCVGTVFDLIINKETGQVEADSGPWRANHHVKDGADVRVSDDNTYYDGYTVKKQMPDTKIQKLGKGIMLPPWPTESPCISCPSHRVDTLVAIA